MTMLRVRSRKTETDGPITDKINKHVSAAEERILKQLRPVVEKVEEHDIIVQQHGNFLGMLSRKMTESFSGLIHFDEKVNGKKKT